jgi:hypothetical protein
MSGVSIASILPTSPSFLRDTASAMQAAATRHAGVHGQPAVLRNHMRLRQIAVTRICTAAAGLIGRAGRELRGRARSHLTAYI